MMPFQWTQWNVRPPFLYSYSRRGKCSFGEFNFWWLRPRSSVLCCSLKWPFGFSVTNSFIFFPFVWCMVIKHCVYVEWLFIVIWYAAQRHNLQDIEFKVFLTVTDCPLKLVFIFLLTAAVLWSKSRSLSVYSKSDHIT